MRRLLEILFGLKPDQLAGAHSWSLNFAADYNNWIVLGMVVVFAALVLLTVLSYLREGDLPRRIKLTLASIRIVVIVLIFAMLLQPGLLLRYKKDLYSTLVVLVDDSISMSLKDRYADAGLRKAVADKLNVGAEELGNLSRLELVRRVLARAGGALAELSRDHPMVLLQFSTSQPGQEVYTRPLAVLDMTQQADPAAATEAARELAAAMAKLSGGGFETNLASALRDAVDRMQGRRVSGIVLLSDGQATSGNLSAALAYVRQRNWPIFAVGVGDPVPPQDIEVLNLQGPPEVRRGSDVELTAYVSNRNCGGRTVEVRLYRKKAAAAEWTDTGDAVSVKLAGEGAERSESQEVVLRTKAAELGEFVYKAEVKPIDGEFSTQNNAATTKVKISDNLIKVLLVSGDAGWEFQYLRNLLIRSPDRYAVSIWQQDAEKEFNQEASTGMKLAQLPRTKKEMFEYEVVVLYDPAYTENGFDKTFAELLKDFVAEHQGGLCYVASNKNSDANLTSAGPFDSLIELLPVVLDRQSLSLTIVEISQGEPTPWAVVPTAVGFEHPVLRLGKEMNETTSAWKILPGVYWSHPVVRLKPLASALAVSADPVRRTSDGSAEPLPVIAVQYFGKGRSLYVGTDETWRWRFVNDAAYYQRFWQNLVDFLAAGRLQRKRVILTTGAERFSIGEEMRLRAEVYDRDYQPLAEETFTVEMVDTATGKAQTISLSREAKKKTKGHFEAVVPLQTVGTFELTAMRDNPEYKDEVAGKTITVLLPEEETRRPESDPQTLATIAPEGRSLALPEADRLKELVPPGRMTVFHDVPHDLWDVPLTIVAVIVLLGAEWILRKRYHMT